MIAVRRIGVMLSQPLDNAFVMPVTILKRRRFDIYIYIIAGVSFRVQNNRRQLYPPSDCGV